MRILEFIIILILVLGICVMALFIRWQNSASVESNISKADVKMETETAAHDYYSELPVTRIEFLVLLGRKLGLEQEYGPVGFSDVNPDSINSRYIYPFLKAGLLSGYPDNTFRPNELITKNEAEIIVAKALKRPIPPWYDKSPCLTKKQMFTLLSEINSKEKW